MCVGILVGNIFFNIFCSDYFKYDVYIILYLFCELNGINLLLNFFKYF